MIVFSSASRSTAMHRARRTSGFIVSVCSVLKYTRTLRKDGTRTTCSAGMLPMRDASTGEIGVATSASPAITCAIRLCSSGAILIVTSATLDLVPQ